MPRIKWLAIGLIVGLAITAGSADGRLKIAVLDECDPDDAEAWAPTGGCTLEDGDVSFAEFQAMRFSPLALSIIGHMAWRTDPTYLRVEPGRTVRVTNDGGRGHTFTEVAQFGGGVVPPLNQGLTGAPECLNAGNVASTTLDPGDSLEVTNLPIGDHRFQCCIHPWMRTQVKVEDRANSGR